MSEQKMREALERIANMAVQYSGVFAARVIETAAEALAQQPAAGVELTDAELKSLYCNSEFCGEVMAGDEIKFARAVIAAHEAKKSGGGV